MIVKNLFEVVFLLGVVEAILNYLKSYIELGVSLHILVKCSTELVGGSLFGAFCRESSMANSRAAAAEARIAQLAKRLDALEGVGAAGEFPNSQTPTQAQL